MSGKVKTLLEAAKGIQKIFLGGFFSVKGGTPSLSPPVPRNGKPFCQKKLTGIGCHPLQPPTPSHEQKVVENFAIKWSNRAEFFYIKMTGIFAEFFRSEILVPLFTYLNISLPFFLNLIAVSGPTEHCSMFHFPPSVRPPPSQA